MNPDTPTPLLRPRLLTWIALLILTAWGAYAIGHHRGLDSTGVKMNELLLYEGRAWRPVRDFTYRIKLQAPARTPDDDWL
jgi:hypothetical protein